MSVHICERDGSLEITAMIGTPQRCFVGALALFPLLAPYELMIRVPWQSFWNPFFLFAAAVSIGAVSVSVLLVLIAFGGRNRRTTIDTTAQTVSIVEWSPVGREKKRMLALGAVKGFDVRVHQWTESDTYSLDLESVAGERFGIASSSSRADVEGYRATVALFLQPR